MNFTGPLSKDSINGGCWYEHSIEIPADLKETFKKGWIEQVEVIRKTGIWIVHLVLQDEVDKIYLYQMSEYWQSNIPGLEQVKWKIRYQCSKAKAVHILTQEWPDIVDALVEDFPFLKGWLKTSTILFNHAEQLVITLESKVAEQWLEEKGTRKILAAWLEQKVGWRPQIIWEVKPNLLNQKIKEEKEKQYLANLLEQNQSNGVKNNKSNNTDQVMPKKEGNQVWLGRPIHSTPILLKELVEEERSVTVQGRVFDLSERELRSGRTLIIFSITDYSDSITVKLYLDKKSTDDLKEYLKEGVWVVVRGMAQVDRHSQELTLMAQDINAGNAPERKDKAAQKRIELHLHTKMSALDGLVDVDALMKRVSKWGHEAVAITDHGVVQAFPEAFEKASKYGVKVIYGIEGYLTDELKPRKVSKNERLPTYHIVLLARNQAGLNNLYRLVSISHLENFYRRPRIARQELLRLREGLLLGTACEAGELIQAYLKGESRERLEEIAAFYDFIEIQPLHNNQFLVRNGQVSDEEGLRQLNRTLLEIGEKLGKPVVATGDVHFLDPEDEYYRKIILAGKGFEDAEFQAPLYLRTTEEMLEEFSYLGEETSRRVVIDNPQYINSLIDKDIRPVPEGLHAPQIPGAEDQIMEMTYQSARQLYGDPLPTLVQARIKQELDSIIGNGFAVLYLIAQKLVKKSNEDGYLVGSRGSVGSSFVAYLIGITEVNPLSPHYRCPQCCHVEFVLDGSVGCGADLTERKCPNCGTIYYQDGYEIPFETFLGFKGDKVPDIDLNFSGEYQNQAHRYVEELFGREHVFRAGTIATIAAKTAYGMVKKYFDQNHLQAREAEINRLVKGCTGVKRTTGQHPGGLMIVPRGNNVYQFTPVQYPADDTKSLVITTHFDYESISSRLVKLDILGHDDPTVIRMLQDLTGLDPRKVKIGEKTTMRIFSGTEPLGVTPEQIRSKVGTYGIPEFGTRFVRQMLEDTRPQTFADLIRISGFSHGTDVWLNNAQDLIKSGQVKLAEAISTRDDIMTYLIQRGLEPSFAFKIMEDVRKGKGLKPDYEKEMQANQVPDWYINSCNRIKYMFPKAHAVAYVVMAFRIAFFKVYYPEAFYTSFFTVRADEFDAQLIVGGSEKIRKTIEELEQKGNAATAKEKNLLIILEVALEMYERGLKMLKVSLEKSDAYRFIITPQGILPPLVALQGVGQAAAASIVEAYKQRPFTSVEDLRRRARVGKNIIDALREHGCLHDLPESDQLTLF